MGGHRDIATTRRYADYAPDPAGAAAVVARVFEPRTKFAHLLSGTEGKMGQQKPL